MKNLQPLVRQGFGVALCAAGLGLAPVTATADTIIEFTGMNLVYNGSSLVDAGSAAGGVRNPTDADALATVDFFSNGSLVGSLDSDISLDILIPDVVNIPAGANVHYQQTTPGNPGFFDLLIGTSPLASEFLQLDLENVSIVYSDISGLARFTFGAAIAESSSQNLPFGLTMTDPITVSFSAQVDPATLTSAGGFITGFEAFGTGEFAEAIPEPASLALLMLGAAAGLRRRSA
ncbi:MAG: hypothetical protein AMXMBFR47_41090 [Planctomycetota bacterium]